MNKIFILGGLLLAVVGTLGCACYGPGYGGGFCGNTIAPYSCGPSSCGGMGVDYVDGGPCAGYADCGGCGSAYYTGCGSGCGRHIVNGLKVVGEGAVGLVAAPFILVGSLFTDGCYARYPNCGCSNEVYYGDNCYQPHDFCDPCNPCGGSHVTQTVGHAYPPTPPGCSNCAGGYTGGCGTNVDSGEVVGDEIVSNKQNTMQTQQANRPQSRVAQRYSGPYAQNQSTQRITPPRPLAKSVSEPVR